MSCMAKGSFLLAQSIQNCSSFDMNIALRATKYAPEEGIHQQLRLHRLGLRAGVAKDKFASRLFLAQVQTGGEQSYIGIEGESITLRVEMADLRYQPWDFVQISTGIVDDLWVESETIHWQRRDLEKNLAEEYRWSTRGQVGSSVLFRFPKELGFAAFSYTTGEGAYRRERNNGKNISGLIEMYPFQSRLFGLSLYGQDGSYGLTSSRNHRVGARLSSNWSNGQAGLSGIKAWGLLSDIQDEPLLLSAWMDQRIWKSFSGVIRFGEERRLPGKNRDFLGGLSYSPQTDTELWIGWKSLETDPQSTGVSGATSLQQQHQFFIQFNGRLEVL